MVQTVFSPDGTLHTYTVPAGVVSLTVALTGGSGGGAYGGGGAGLNGTLAVTPGETLYIVVGKQGVDTGAEGTGYGSNGGRSFPPNPGGEGGGQSIIFQGGLTRANMRAVAGGGGGSGGLATASVGVGGNAGLNVGGTGTSGNTAPGGGPGSTTAGTGGTASGGGSPGVGGADVGGRGGTGAGSAGSGGGGGAGYYGGAGGAASATAIGGGGGGGSSYTGGLTGVTYLGVFSGPGVVVIEVPNQPPYAPTLTAPVDGVILNRGSATVFNWTFADPVTGDSQSAYEWRYAVAGSGSFVSSGKTVSTAPTLTIPANAFAATTYEWQVRTWDTSDVVGPWSPSRTFTAADLPATPVITAPASGGTVTAPSFVATWTSVTHTSYQVRRVADVSGSASPSTVYYDTGEVVSAGNSQPLTFDVTGRDEHVQVRVKASGLWSAWADALVHVAFTPPSRPFAQLIEDDEQAAIHLALAVFPNLLTADAASFEGSNGGWVGGVNTVDPPTTGTTALIGTKGLKAQAIGAGNVRVSNNGGGLGVDITGLDVVTASVAVKAVTTARTVNVYLEFNTGTNPAPFTAPDSTSAWSRYAVSAAVPPGATKARVIVEVIGAVTGEVHAVDAATIREGMSSAYAPGGLPLPVSFEVYRRETPDTGPGIRILKGAGLDFTDWTPASDQNYEYRVVAVGADGATSTSEWLGQPTDIFVDTFLDTY